MIKIFDLHPHYNFLWDIKQMRGGKEPVDLDKIFNGVHSIIDSYDNEVEELENKTFEYDSLDDMMIELYEKIMFRLKHAKELDIGFEIYKEKFNPNFIQGLLISEDGVEVLDNDECVYNIPSVVFSENWKEEFSKLKDKKDELVKIEKEREAERNRILNSDEYKEYIKLKEKIDKALESC
ncbi:MAG: hypothetical protein ACRDDY_03335 [Clostridium sp.]|uniref:hypothetical protein n=1 Tax=Clostridium sp. TaxID=1506 RepID=UPI003EE443D2